MNFIQHNLKNFVFLFLIFYLALAFNIQSCFADPVRDCYKAICPSVDFNSDLINKSKAITTKIPDLDSPIHQNDLKESLNESLRMKFDINSSNIQSENSYLLIAYWILATGLNDMVFVSHKDIEDTRKFFLDNYYQMENVNDELNMVFTSLIKSTIRKPQIINKKNILEGVLKDPKKISSLLPLADEKKIRIAYKAIQVDDSSTESIGEILNLSSSKSNSKTMQGLIEKNYTLSLLKLIDIKALVALRPQILKFFDEIIKSKKTASENKFEESAMSHLKIFFNTYQEFPRFLA